MEKMICIAGFGDDSSMFTALASSSLATCVEIIPFNLPGFGAPAFAEKPTTLKAVAQVVDAKAHDCGARIVLAHSVASIIASLAALRDGSPIKTILSLEGNLTAEDAYFSGSATRYGTPSDFRTAFLARLSRMEDAQSIIARYRSTVENADPTALWQLGKDAHKFSQEHSPGDLLMRSASVTYLYNPANLPARSLLWLEAHDLPRIALRNASHWASVDSPDLLAKSIKQALSNDGAVN